MDCVHDLMTFWPNYNVCSDITFLFNLEGKIYVLKSLKIEARTYKLSRATNELEVYHKEMGQK